MVRPLVALAALAVVLAGCGGGASDETQVRAAVDDFGKATASHDYAKLCGMPAPKLVEQVKSVGLSCEKALQQGLGGVRNPRIVVGKVTVNGDSATAEVRTSASGQQPSRDALKLTKVGGRWRIASLGS